MAAAERIWRVVEHCPADQLPDLFSDTAADVVRRLAEGEPPEIATTADYLRMVEAADKLHKMGRLAAGQSTSNNASLHVDVDALADKVQRLRDASTPLRE